LFANALREAVEKTSRARPEVKWPNDLVINSKKLAGILIEMKISGSKVDYAIVGVGLNVNLTAEELPAGATSILIDTRQEIKLENTLRSVLSAFVEHYENFRDAKSIMTDWWNSCAHRMKPVRIKTHNRLVKGKCIGVNSDGSVVVETDKGIITATDGTLRLDT
jgi:BirA family biotin operon repressor/biotin-[acetyl-CoA-carboxylase] ligase